MGRIYRSAMGKSVDMDRLRLMNEENIAVGNMKVNARGDQLGFGGEVVKSRNELMDDYYRVNAEMVLNGETQAQPSVQQAAESIEQRNQKSSNTVRGSLAKKILDDQDGEQ
jgi:hypothetical protein